MFFLLVAAVLGIFVFLFDGAAAMVGICFYGALFCAMFGISKGLFTIIDYNGITRTNARNKPSETGTSCLWVR